MAETLLTYNQWLASLADNETGEIGAQDLKDALYSLQSNWLVMAKRLTSDQSGFSTATKVTMNAGHEALGQEPGYNGGLDRLTIQAGGDGQYLLHYGCCVKKTTGTADFDLMIYKNGIQSYSFGPQPKVSLRDADWESMSGVGVWTGTIATDYFELWGTTSGGGSVLVNNAYLFLQRIR